MITTKCPKEIELFYPDELAETQDLSDEAYSALWSLIAHDEKHYPGELDTDLTLSARWKLLPEEAQKEIIEKLPAFEL